MIAIAPTGGPLGATVRGVDLSQALDREVVAAIRRAWLDHLVLTFPDQALAPSAFLSFARTIGEPAQYPFLTGIEGFPEIIEVVKHPTDTVNFGGIWHSDTVYLERPPMASMLVARDIPETGGDTEFANMYLAYETLPDDLRTLIDPLRAVHRSDRAAAIRTNTDADRAGEPNPIFESEHPVVRTHPETGRCSLFVNIAHTVRFAGWTEVDSRPVLDELFAHQVRPEHVWRLKWRRGMVTLWDNRCTLHHPLNDYPGRLRRMHRITLAGDVPV